MHAPPGGKLGAARRHTRVAGLCVLVRSGGWESNLGHV